MGIVPQDPLLFSGTISDNISLSNKEIKQEEIISAAKIADAHDFIMELPDGYSTEVKERGVHWVEGRDKELLLQEL